jgi:hypothetical protein
MDPYFLTSALAGGELSALRPSRFNSEYPLDRKLGEPQRRSIRLGEEKILDSTGTGTSTPRLSTPQPVAIPTELSRLLTQTKNTTKK